MFLKDSDSIVKIDNISITTYMATGFDISSFVESFWLKSSFAHQTNDVMLAYSFVLACYHCRCLATLEVAFVQLAFYCHVILSYSFKYEVVSKLVTPTMLVKYERWK